MSEPPIEARIEIDLRDRHIDALKADREQLRGLVEEYIGTVNALKAQNAALKEQVDDKRSQLLLMAGDLNKSDAQNATLTAERDEARATKDMHKERQEQAWAEVERLRDLLDTLNPPEQCPATCTCGYGCPHGDGCLALCDCPEWEPPNGPYDEARAIRSAREAGKGR